MILVGPFLALVTMRNLPIAGHLRDDDLEIIPQAGILVEGSTIAEMGPYKDLQAKAGLFIKLDFPAVGFPGLVDAHTHMCWAGNRANEYSARLEGKTYEEIAREGGGILNTVKAVRAATEEELIHDLLERCAHQLAQGITTSEVKSGYGLNVDDEIKMLKAIRAASKVQPVELVPTCLAAHTLPKEFNDKKAYLKYLQTNLWPIVKEQNLAKRMDIFVDQCAFSTDLAHEYLLAAKEMGFDILLHAEQFTQGGAKLAATLHAKSADHLEVISTEDATLLAQNKVSAVVLPCATLGLGLPFPPARMLLDKGASLVVATDWNPGSAPMGDLLTGAALLSANQKLSMAETWAGITYRAAHALGLSNTGKLDTGNKCAISVYPCRDWREVLYYQGGLKPSKVIVL